MIYRFGSCELDADRRELRRDGRPLSVEPRVFELLAYLVANRDRILTKDEINREVWDSRIVSDAALSSCIKSVRQAIGDDGKTQALVRTAHGRGFHFIADVECDEPGNIGAREKHERPIIAVAPFANLSGNPAEDYFSDGLTADIIGALARHRWLIVVARNTMVQFKGNAATIDAIAHATGADYVIEGSVRKRDARVRVNVQLVDARGGGCIWSENYDRECADIFEVQDSITQTIAARLEPAIGVEERRKISRTVGSRDLRAWEAYHLGIAHLFKFTETDNLRAQELLQKARELDPAFGDAHAWWAYAVVLGTVYWAVEATSARLDEALDATQTALEIDDSNSTFYALKARVQLARQEYESAIEGNKLAIELNPTFAAAHCGLADSLTYLGRYDEAIRQFEHAIALSSNDPQRWAFFTYGALAFIFKGDFERAVEWADRAAEIPNHQYWTYAHKAVALALMGKEAEARHALAAALAKEPRLSVRYARERLYYLKDTAQLDRYAEGLERAGASIT
jgi:TolB-like protein/Tfp pilus assembly protein PilF